MIALRLLGIGNVAAGGASCRSRLVHSWQIVPHIQASESVFHPHHAVSISCRYIRWRRGGRPRWITRGPRGSIPP